jgi:hypothetical protein
MPCAQKHVSTAAAPGLATCGRNDSDDDDVEDVSNDDK